MKKYLVILWLTVLVSSVGSLFWYNEWMYNLPTEIPADYQEIAIGNKIEASLSTTPLNDKPIFLHFYNPDCPCSRFNVPHFKALVKQYGSSVNFAIVPMVSKSFDPKKITDVFGMDIPIILDQDLPKQCGVYSTPQAVIINPDHSLFYRGNYNKTRYCADRKTEFARMALENLLAEEKNLNFDPIAFKAYGCKLPVCKQ